MNDLISRISLKQSIVVSMILADGKTLEQIIDEEPSIDAIPVSVVRCKDCKHRFLEIINGEMVFSCLYRMGTLDLNGYCDCGAKMDGGDL